jgi:tripartite-type tricarboxylate transporter receptor subunit TctC
MRRVASTIRGALLAAALPLLAAPQVQAADAVTDFYKGKTVTMIVGYTPGSTYDMWARLVGKHLGKHIPGTPTVVVQNMPGAGSVTASNHVYNIAPQDGTVMGLMSSNNPFAPLQGVTEARYEPTKFTWLGSPTIDTAVIMVWNTAPVNTFEDAKATQVLLGSTSPNGTSSFYTRIFNAIFKTKFKTVYGYPGMAETFIAIERGEVMGHASPFWSIMKSTKADWVRDKKVKFLAQYGGRKNPDIPEVPFLRDLITNDDDRKLFDAAMAPLSVGYPFLAGPGVPADRTAALRKAYQDTFKDPEFLAEAGRSNLDIAPVTGEQTLKTIQDVYAMPKPILDRMRVLFDTDDSK